MGRAAGLPFMTRSGHHLQDRRQGRRPVDLQSLESPIRFVSAMTRGSERNGSI
jgi:hypothetical protein